MNKKIVSITVLAVSQLFSQTANAQEAWVDQANTTYASFQVGYSFGSALNDGTALENLNFPGPPSSTSTFPSDLSTLDFDDSVTFGLKFGVSDIKNSNFGIELDVLRYEPDLLSQDVFINVDVPGVDEDVVVAENQLPADLRVLSFNPLLVYKFRRNKRFRPYVAVGPSLSRINTSGIGTSCRNLSDLEEFGSFVNECPAPEFSESGIGFGVASNVGFSAKVTPKIELFGEYKFQFNRLRAREFRSLLDISGNDTTNFITVGATYKFSSKG